MGIERGIQAATILSTRYAYTRGGSSVDLLHSSTGKYVRESILQRYKRILSKGNASHSRTYVVMTSSRNSSGEASSLFKGIKIGWKSHRPSSARCDLTYALSVGDSVHPFSYTQKIRQPSTRYNTIKGAFTEDTRSLCCVKQCSLLIWV